MSLIRIEKLVAVGCSARNPCHEIVSGICGFREEIVVWEVWWFSGFEH